MSKFIAGFLVGVDGGHQSAADPVDNIYPPELAQFDISLTDCRTTVCSVHALGNGPDSLTLLNAATADLVSQPWFEFNNMSMNRRNPVPDVLAVVLILTKNPST